MRHYAELIRRIPELSDGRLRIRRWHRRDVPAIVDALADGSVSEWIVGMPHPYTRDDAKRFVARASNELEAGVGAHMALEDLQRGKIVGAVAVEMRGVRQAAEMGYWIAPRERGRGYTCAALRVLMAWAYSDLALARLELIIHLRNPFSQLVASRCGFRREGIARAYLEHRGVRGDYFIFARLAHDLDPPPHAILETVATSPGAASLPLVLRPWKMADANVAVAWLRDDDQVRRWAMSIEYPVTLEGERLHFAEAWRRWVEQGVPVFAVVNEQAGEVVGSASAKHGQTPGTAELGYMVRPEARGRGVATAALGALTDWCLGPGGFTVCELQIDPQNLASQRTAEAAGYERTCISRSCADAGGRAHEHIVFSRHREDPPA